MNGGSPYNPPHPVDGRDGSGSRWSPNNVLRQSARGGHYNPDLSKQSGSSQLPAQEPRVEEVFDSLQLDQNIEEVDDEEPLDVATAGGLPGDSQVHGDAMPLMRQSYDKLSADSWMTVESEFDSQGENMLFAMVEEEPNPHRPRSTTNAHNVMSKASNYNGKSVLDCVVDLLRGTRAQKKKSMFRKAAEKWIWLGDDLATLFWKSKKRPDINGKINLIKCRALKSNDLSITFTMDRKKLVLVLASKDEVKLWITGLSCLVLRETKVLMDSRFLTERVKYDPLRDSWQGKLISSRKRVNEYILLGGIGRGAFGKVKLAISTSDKRFYAVKIINKQRKGSFLSEASKEEHAILRKLKHPNIVKHRDILYEESTERIVLVVEYMARGVVMDSSKLEGVKPLSEDGVREIMRDVVSGLLFLHQQRVVHRDIKPDNLLRSGDGAVKLGDFGESRMYDVHDPDTRGKPAAPGTPAFLAPEFCMSVNSPKSPAENYAADVWSLGATIYYMVYGRAPFIASSVFELYDAICTENLRFPAVPKTSPKMKQLLRAMLTKEPMKRARLQDVAADSWFEEPVRTRPAERIRVTKTDIENAIRKATWFDPNDAGKH